MYAREAAWRVRERLEAERREKERHEREKQIREREKHALKPRKNQPVESNSEAALFAAEQRRINLERKVKRQQEMREVQRKMMEDFSKEGAEAEERRAREKERLKNNLRRKSEEHKKCFEVKVDHQLAAQRAQRFQRDRPELVARSKSVAARNEVNRGIVQVNELPGTREALQRIKRFRQIEQERKLQEDQWQMEKRKARSEHHKQLMNNIGNTRARSRARKEMNGESFDLASMDQRIKEIRELIKNVTSPAADDE